MTSGYICLKGLRFHAFIGVAEQERTVGNDYIADLRIRYPFGEALESDNLSATLNYAEVFETVRDVMRCPCQLLEFAAGEIASALCRRFPDIETIDLNLTKVNPPMGADCDGAGVEIHLINNKTEE